MGIELHIFTREDLNNPGMTTYNIQEYKKLSSLDQIFPVRSNSSKRWMLSFSEEEIKEANPENFIKNIWNGFAAKGQNNTIEAVYVHLPYSVKKKPEETIVMWVVFFMVALDKLAPENKCDYLYCRKDNNGQIQFNKIFSGNKNQTVQEALDEESNEARAMRNLYNNLGMEMDDSLIGRRIINDSDSLEYADDEFDDNIDDEDDEDDNEDEDDEFGFEESECAKHSKAKRNWKEHGLMIAPKDKIKHDKKVIRWFLKEFIPGDSPTAADMRAQLEKRWINAMVISKKEANSKQGSRVFNKVGRVAKEGLGITANVINVAQCVGSLIGKGRL